MVEENTEVQTLSDEDKAYAALGEQGSASQELIAGKFKTTDELVKSYKELEAKLGSNSVQGATEEVDETPAEEPPQDQTEEAAKEVVEKAGLDWDALEAKLNTTGKLDEADYKALSEAGIQSRTVDAFIAGQQAIAREIGGEVADKVGGDEAYDAMVEWAGKNWTQGQIDAYDKAVTSGDLASATLAAKGLQQAYIESNGSEPNLLGGNTTSTTGGVFKSTQDMVNAMADPRYAESPEFRAEVDAKIARSQI